MSKITSLEDLLHDELKDLYDAETRLTKAIPKMVKRASDQNLRAALEAHLAETETHLERLEHALEILGEEAEGRSCIGMKGILDEAKEHMSAKYDTDELRDVVIIAAAQRAELYEIAAYRTAIAHAKQTGHADIASLLEESFAEEKVSDEKLARIGDALNAAALTAAAADDNEDDDDADDEDEDSDDDEDEHEDEHDDEHDDDADVDDEDDDDEDEAEDEDETTTTAKKNSRRR